MMGVGQDTVGQRARRAARPAVRRHRRRWSRRAPGRTVREIFEADGERPSACSRAEALRDALGAAGAGGDRRRPAASCSPRRTARLLRSGRRRGRVAARRPGDRWSSARRRGDHRPLLDDDPARRPATRWPPSAIRCTRGRRRGRRHRRDGSTRRRGRRRSSSRRRRRCRRDHRAGRARRPLLRRARRRRRAAPSSLDVLPAASRRAAVVTQAAIGVDVDPGVEHRVFRIGDGEDGQDARHRRGAVPRSSPVGPHPRRRASSPSAAGMVTDVAGFAAAVYHRGVAVVHVADDAARAWSTPPSAARPA